MYEYDELQIYRGRDIQLTPKITITQPTLDQIERFSEKMYFNAIYTFTSVGADLKWQLWELGVDFTKIEDYDLFIKYIFPVVSSKKRLHDELINNPEKYKEHLVNFTQDDLDRMLINPMQLILKDIDLADFDLYKKIDNEQIILYDAERDITIDKVVYTRMVDVVRKMHGFKRNNEIPANESTKMDMIEDARDEAIKAANKPYKSILKPLISAFSAKCGLYGDDRIWQMPISMFFDGIKRINKIQDAELLLQGAYSGFASLKGIDKDRLYMFGDI